MEFDDFGDLFGDEVLEMEEKDVEKDEIEQEKNTQKAKDLENVWEKTEEDETKNLKRKIRRPQPKLSEKELTSEKGIEALKASFDNFNFPKECDPYQKLDILLNKMECWAHNLFPKMNFDDCLDKIEKLGRKRLVQATMKRLRPGFSQTEDDEEIVEDENVEKDENAPTINSKETHKKNQKSKKLVDSSDEDNDDLDKYLDSLKTQQSNQQKDEEMRGKDSDENSEIIQTKEVKRRKIIDEDE
uniref:TIMELESS-interacting protein n=1 Tax=Meloidogyne incognita TaxID=6306 RepID=A0A914M8U7_MELIC